MERQDELKMENFDLVLLGGRIWDLGGDLFGIGSHLETSKQFDVTACYAATIT